MKMAASRSRLIEGVSRMSRPLLGTAADFDSLLKRTARASCVLLGEATHGTHEFYRARAEITKRLILEQGVTLIAWEADWPDALRLNRYIRGDSSDPSAAAALDGFKRFPVWMWRNQEIVELIEWLRAHNQSLRPDQPHVGVYGLDLYSLHASIAAVVAYLEKVNSAAAADARLRYACFENFGDNDPQTYGRIASLSRSYSCEQQVVDQLVELQRRAAEFLRRDGRIAQDELFYAEQNARVARDAEEYYRALYHGRANTWNLRDAHMVRTLEELMAHFRKQGLRPKAVVWAHNSHLGDARATEMARRDEINVGQLMRERHRERVALVGFTTFSGTVTAASEWGGVTERKRVRAAMEGSVERLFHECHLGDFSLLFGHGGDLDHELNTGLLERMIGVIYRPDMERYSHYLFANLAEQFDLVFHYDHTRAVQPLDRTSEWDAGEMPETYPSGL